MYHLYVWSLQRPEETMKSPETNYRVWATMWVLEAKLRAASAMLSPARTLPYFIQLFVPLNMLIILNFLFGIAFNSLWLDVNAIGLFIYFFFFWSCVGFLVSAYCIVNCMTDMFWWFLFISYILSVGIIAVFRWYLGLVVYSLEMVLHLSSISCPEWILYYYCAVSWVGYYIIPVQLSY